MLRMASASVSKAVDRAISEVEAMLPDSVKEHSAAIVYTVGGTVAFLALRAAARKFYKSNPFKFGRTGALAKDEIGSSIVDYEKFFDQKAGKGIEDGQVAGKSKSNTPEFVDKFYRRVTGNVLAGLAVRTQRSSFSLRMGLTFTCCFLKEGTADRLRAARLACALPSAYGWQ